MANITKKELVDSIADATGENQAVVKLIVQAFMDAVIVELGKGNRLEFRDFGVFEVRSRKSRTNMGTANVAGSVSSPVGSQLPIGPRPWRLLL